MSQTINIRRRATSTVPDDILTNSSLGWAARVVLGWMLGRSPEFELHVWYVRKTFKLTERQWVRIRRELEQEGYYLQSKEQDEDSGKFKWTNVVSDKQEFSPQVLQPSPLRPSLQKQGDGHPPPQKPSDGQPSDGGQRDIPVVNQTNCSNTTTTATQPVIGGGVLFEKLDIEPVIEPYCLQLLQVLQLSGVADQELAQDLLDELAGTIEAGKKGERSKVGNPSAWLQALTTGEFKRARCIDIRRRREARREALLQQNLARRHETHSLSDPVAVAVKAAGDKFIEDTLRRREGRIAAGQR